MQQKKEHQRMVMQVGRRKEQMMDNICDKTWNEIYYLHTVEKVTVMTLQPVVVYAEPFIRAT
jgi:REP element-mobilizing transposase RayT